jgi:hypothetical protein
MLLWNNGKYFGYSRDESGDFLLNDDFTIIEERNGFSRKKYFNEKDKTPTISAMQIQAIE